MTTNTPPRSAHCGLNPSQICREESETPQPHPRRVRRAMDHQPTTTLMTAGPLNGVASGPWCKRATGVGSFEELPTHERTYTRGTTSIAH
jgi:hypothetical protein